MPTSRFGSTGHSAPQPPQSIEAVRRRARHRLIGAAVLVLVGVVGFTLMFDTQPRPIAVDIPIDIPSRNSAPAAKAAGLAATAPAPSSESAPAARGTPVAAADSLGAREEVVESRPADKHVGKAPEKSGNKADAKAGDRTTTDKPATGNERIMVQVGAFADVERAREVRLKLERAGFKTYTNVVETPQGKRIRVRMGPFATKAEAEKAAARARALGLSASLLWQ